MRRPRFVILIVLAAAGAAHAQTAAPWPGRAYLAVSGDYQASSSNFTDTLSFPKFVETETVTSSYQVGRAPGFDVAGGVRIWRGLAVGAGVTRFATSNAAAVNASIPHPFFFARARQVSGDGGVQHVETALHVHAAWLLPVGNRWQVTVFGGPSFFMAKQGLVTDITVSDTYPYDTATFTSASVERQPESKLGAHAGVDVAFMFLRHVGAGGLIRFSRSTLRFSNANGQSVDVTAGGAQVGAGLRLRFD